MDLLGGASAADVLWEEIVRLQGESFQTARGIEYRYEIRGNEMFVDRRDKSITRATVELSYYNAVKLLRRGEIVDGPKKLGTFGASYLFPIFLRLGVIPPLEEQLRNI